MTPSTCRRVDRQVLAAAALEPEEWQRFLDGLGDEDAAVVEAVRRRLRRARELPPDFLRSPASELLATTWAGTMTAGLEDGGSPAGDERYEIGERLGSGGMAVVYRAYDRQLDRTVALKVLRATDPETPRRLLREARAQARVSHDHVLDVYETGELDGRPYIAVRHVAGGSLDALDEVGLEGRVRLMAQVAEGLHAAHRQGLLHGDVKPSNVLVEETPDGELKAWIGDFGIATELGGDGSAGAGLAGTPTYMAPELLRRDAPAPDRRSDVFSLGVTLHRVLTGERRPRDGAARTGAHRAAASLPPDLAAIVDRCADRDPAARYPSARAVAEDLRRFLDGEVVEAYADRLAYRITRFAARHRTLLSVAGVSASLLAAALAVAAVMGVRAVRANAVAEQRRGQAEELIGYMLLDLREKLQAVGRLELLDDVGERAMAYFAAVPEDELSDEELARRATALHQIGEVRMRRGDLAGAEAPLRESLQVARRLAARRPDDAERLFDLGQSEFWLGYALWERGELEAARRHFEAYHQISARLVARDAENLDWQLELSYAQSNLGSILEAQGDLEAALERFLAALEVNRRLVDRAPGHADADGWRFELAAGHNTVGVVLEKLGRPEAARGHYEADLALRRELAARDPANLRWREFLGTSHQYLGNFLLSRGDSAAARPHLEAARELFEELTAHDPADRQWRYKQAWSLVWAGRLERTDGGAAKALASWSRAHRLAAELARLDPERVDRRRLHGVTLYHLAVGRAERDAAAAEEAARRAVEILEPLVAVGPQDRYARRWLAESLLLLGDLAVDRGDPEDAARSWRRAAEAVRPMVVAGSRDLHVLRPWNAARDRLDAEDPSTHHPRRQP